MYMHIFHTREVYGRFYILNWKGNSRPDIKKTRLGYARLRNGCQYSKTRLEIRGQKELDYIVRSQ